MGMRIRTRTKMRKMMKARTPLRTRILTI